MVRKSKLWRVPWRDVLGSARFVTLPKHDNQPLAEALLCALYATGGGTDQHIAAGVLLCALDESALNPDRALCILRAYDLADGRLSQPDHVKHQLLAAVVCQLPYNRRAEMYYVCCDVLGYDPAEQSHQPERF